MNLFGKSKDGTVHPAFIDSEIEHRISLPGLEIAINNTTKVVYVVDMTGGSGVESLQRLEDWLNKSGYFLHCVKVEAPSTPPPASAEEQHIGPKYLRMGEKDKS